MERAALTRRLYVFAVLLAAVLVLLSSGSFLIFRLLNVLLAIGVESAQPVLGIVGRALSVSLVAAGVGAYHWRVLREDNAQRALEAVETEGPVVAAERVVVEIVGATPADITGSLAALPPGARYSIRVPEMPPAEPPGRY